MHKQVFVKVNVPVDEGIADTITVLSTFPKLMTVESCQGGGGRNAWVCFEYGTRLPGRWAEVAEFVLGFLGPHLVKRVGDSAHVAITVTGFGTYRGEISIRPGAVSSVTRALRSLRRDFPD